MTNNPIQVAPPPVQINSNQEAQAISQTPIQAVPPNAQEVKTTFPKYPLYLAIAFGGLTAVLSLLFYQGKYLPDLLVSYFETKQEEIISPPGIGFDYSSNLYKIPKTVFNSPSEVRVLGINSSHLGSFPKEIFLLNSLTRLQLKDSGIKILPNEIGSLQTLETLDIGGNKISVLPESIGNLVNLKNLLLYNNKITALPDSITNLELLETLDLHSNNLKSLPTDISRLTNLKLLFLGGNKLDQQEKDRVMNLLPNTQVFF